jgi:hypothetical protein
MKAIITLLLLAIIAFTDDRLLQVPGYPDTDKTRVFAGYLNTSSPLRSLHYILVES